MTNVILFWVLTTVIVAVSARLLFAFYMWHEEKQAQIWRDYEEESKRRREEWKE